MENDVYSIDLQDVSRCVFLVYSCIFHFGQFQPSRLYTRPMDKGVLHLRHCLLKVGNDVLGILDAYRQTDKVRCDTCLAELFVGELTVGM